MLKILSRRIPHSRTAIRSSISTTAPYVRNQNRPLNIAHRGLAGLIPENTLPAFEAALYSGADLIQLDVVFTKDGKLLVMHDPYLHRITNARPDQFPQARQTREYPSDNKTYDTQWTDLLTLEQLKTLKIKQAQAPGRLTSLDYILGFSTLEEVIETVQKFNIQHKGSRNPNKKEGGILIEAKDGDMYRRYRPQVKSIAEEILKVLKKYNIDSWEGGIRNHCPIFLHSFDEETVKEWHTLGTNLPRNQLLEQSTFKDRSLVEYAKQASKYCHGLGVEDTLLYDINNKRPFQDTVDGIKALDMMLHVWTFKDDALPFGAVSPIQAYEIGQNVLKLDGVITEFSDTYSYISHFLMEGRQK